MTHPCIIVAVDTARISGWSIWLAGALLRSGERDMQRDPLAAVEVCADAMRVAEEHSLPAVLVYERPFRGTTQGQWIGSWKAGWAGVGGPQTRMVGVYPATWRAGVLGGGMHAAKREVVRAAEHRAASVLTRRIVGGDEAAAILIGYWATMAPEVATKLPKARARKAVR